jgi:hypothetical protein
MNPFFNAIFSLKKIKLYYCLEINFKNGFSTKIAKINNIRTIGFMHGLSFNSYMSHNFLNFLPKNNKWIDEFLVWSPFWKTYYEKNSSIYRNIKLTRYPRYNDGFDYSLNYQSNSKINVLWICEPLIDLNEVKDYLFYLNENFNLIFKVRSLNCTFYKNLLKNYLVFSTNECRSDKFHLSLNNIHFVIGTHSTAVLESCLYNIKFGIILTETWGNFFEIEFKDILLNNVSDLDVLIKSEFNLKNLNEVKYKYFGIK